MIGLKKRAIKAMGEIRTASFHAFGRSKKRIGTLECYDSLNCSYKDGVLKGGVGVKPYKDINGDKLSVIVTSSNAAVYLTTSNTGTGADSKQVYLLDKEGNLYLRNPSTKKAEKKLFLGPSVEHCALKAEDKKIYNLFAGTADVAMTMDGSSFSTKLWDGVRGSCILGQRYVVARYNGEIRYSAVFSPFEKNTYDPDGSGIIYLPTG